MCVIQNVIVIIRNCKQQNISREEQPQNKKEKKTSYTYHVKINCIENIMHRFKVYKMKTSSHMVKYIIGR